DRKHGLPRVAHLAQASAKVRFLSIEPLLEDLGEIDLSGIDWVIVGGESGPGARPMNKEWVLSIREQCRSYGIPFFFKQWGGVRKAKAGRELDGRTYDEDPRRNPPRMPDKQKRPTFAEHSSSRSGNYSAMTRRWCKLPVNRFFCFPVLRLDAFTLEGERQHEPWGEIDALHRLSRWGRFVSVVRRAVAVGAGCEI